MVVVRFKVGEAEEAALVRLNQKLAANADRIPPGVVGPHRQAALDRRRADPGRDRSGRERYGDDQLRALAAQLRDAIAEVTDVSEVTLIGGRPRQVRVDVDPARLAALRARTRSRCSARSPRPTRARPPAGPVAGGADHRSRGGQPAADRRRRAARRGRRRPSGRAVLVGDVADGRATATPSPRRYVTFQSREAGAHPAVTIAVAKRKGTNAIDVAHRVTREARHAEGHARALPTCSSTITRDYGETAAEKSNELLWHMLLAVALGVGAHLARARPARSGASCSSRFRSRSRSRCSCSTSTATRSTASRSSR